MSIRAKILIGALAGVFTLLAIAGMHFFSDVKDPLQTVVWLCTSVVLGLGIHAASGRPGGGEGGRSLWFFPMVVVGAVCAALAVASISGCTTLYSGYEAAAVKGIKAADDNVVSTLKAATCGVPYGAIQRDATMSQVAKLVCGELPSSAGGLTAADLEALRKLTNPSGVTLTLPAQNAPK